MITKYPKDSIVMEITSVTELQRASVDFINLTPFEVR